MATTVTFLGHGTFLVETHGTHLLIDPFLTGNPAASTTADLVPADVIILSHGHGDHVGDTIDVANRTGALVVANHEIVEWLTRQGLENTHAQHIGGQHAFEWGSLKLTIAHHGSMLPDGSDGGNPCGLLLTLDDSTIYHAADTGLFLDMTLIGEVGIDLAILPIGDNFTMGPDDALKAVKMIKPKQVIPDHYNTWPVIAQDANAWAQRVKNETDTQPLVLSPGESCQLP